MQGEDWRLRECERRRVQVRKWIRVWLTSARSEHNRFRSVVVRVVQGYACLSVHYYPFILQCPPRQLQHMQKGSP